MQSLLYILLSAYRLIDQIALVNVEREKGLLRRSVYGFNERSSGRVAEFIFCFLATSEKADEEKDGVPRLEF